MGDAAHIPSAPSGLGRREEAFSGTWPADRQCLDPAADGFGRQGLVKITRIAAGSPTCRFNLDTEITHQASARSQLGKRRTLKASFTPTPVIRSVPLIRLPGLEFADGAGRA